MGITKTQGTLKGFIALSDVYNVQCPFGSRFQFEAVAVTFLFPSFTLIHATKSTRDVQLDVLAINYWFG